MRRRLRVRHSLRVQRMRASRAERPAGMRQVARSCQSRANRDCMASSIQSESPSARQAMRAARSRVAAWKASKVAASGLDSNARQAFSMAVLLSCMGDITSGGRWGPTAIKWPHGAAEDSKYEESGIGSQGVGDREDAAWGCVVRWE